MATLVSYTCKSFIDLTLELQSEVETKAPSNATSFAIRCCCDFTKNCEYVLFDSCSIPRNSRSTITVPKITNTMDRYDQQITTRQIVRRIASTLKGLSMISMQKN